MSRNTLSYAHLAILASRRNPAGVPLTDAERAAVAGWARATVVAYLAPTQRTHSVDDLATPEYSARDVYEVAYGLADGFGKHSIPVLRDRGILGDWSHLRDSSPDAVCSVAGWLAARGAHVACPPEHRAGVAGAIRKVRAYLRGRARSAA